MKYSLHSPISCERIRHWQGHAAVGAADHSRATLVSDATGRRCLAGTSLRSPPCCSSMHERALFIGLRYSGRHPPGLHLRCFDAEGKRIVQRNSTRVLQGVSIHEKNDLPCTTEPCVRERDS
jgi:hypothetical protein